MTNILPGRDKGTEETGDGSLSPFRVDGKIILPPHGPCAEARLGCAELRLGWGARAGLEREGWVGPGWAVLGCAVRAEVGWKPGISRLFAMRIAEVSGEGQRQTFCRIRKG